MLRQGLLLAAGVFVLDQLSKAFFLYGLGWISTWPLEHNDIRIDLLPVFAVVMVWNRGISYGLLPASSWVETAILVVFSLGVVGMLVWWLKGIKERRLALAIGLIIGGALGNVIDRILYQKVADFFLLHVGDLNWYVFNVADMAIVFGVVLMAVDLLVTEWKARSRGATEDHT
jgi:signal peptidase II